MDDKWKQIQDWATSVSALDALKWERMPEIDLYMDQVITYMEKQLTIYSRNAESKLLTSSMINNYVKEELLPRPERKKYSRDHLAALMMICLLKSELSIPDIMLLRTYFHSSNTEQALYDRFIDAQNKMLKEVAGQLLSADSEESLCELALHLTLEANARRIAAEKILEVLDNGAQTEKKEKAKEKEKEKKGRSKEAKTPAAEKAKPEEGR